MSESKLWYPRKPPTVAELMANPPTFMAQWDIDDYLWAEGKHPIQLLRK